MRIRNADFKQKIVAARANFADPVTFWYGSRSAHLYLWLIDPDPAIFVSDFKEGKKKNNF